VIADMATRYRVPLTTAKRSLTNDVLLATSCRENGVTLVTRDSDYARLSRHLGAFRYVAPWL